ncbi:MAG: hypothetical protein KF722_18580 [Nitrospira sp.]|nr:hypothetical protein [Nitrospira sp.]
MIAASVCWCGHERSTAFIRRAGREKRHVSKNHHAGPVKYNALLAAVLPNVYGHPYRGEAPVLTILIVRGLIGTK